MPFSCIKQTDRHYLLHFLNESLFAATQRCRVWIDSSSVAQPCKASPRHCSCSCQRWCVAAVTPCPVNGQHLCRETRKFGTTHPLLFVLFPWCSFLTALSFLTQPIFSHCHLLQSAFLCITKTPNPFLLAHRTTGTAECQQPQRAAQNSHCALPSTQHSLGTALLCRFSASRLLCSDAGGLQPPAPGLKVIENM